MFYTLSLGEAFSTLIRPILPLQSFQSIDGLTFPVAGYGYPLPQLLAKKIP